MLKFFYTTIKGWKGQDVKYAVGYDHVSKDTMMVSFARCSPKDVFSKEKARAMCAGRLIKGKFIEVNKNGLGTYETLQRAIREHEQKVQENYRTAA